MSLKPGSVVEEWVRDAGLFALSRGWGWQDHVHRDLSNRHRLYKQNSGLQLVDTRVKAEHLKKLKNLLRFPTAKRSLNRAIVTIHIPGLTFGHWEKTQGKITQNSRGKKSKLKITQNFGILEELRMKSPKDQQKSNIAFKILIRSQNSSHFLQNSRKNSKLKDKTQELGISLTPSCRNNGQKTSLT